MGKPTSLPIVSENTVASTIRSSQELCQEPDGFTLGFSRHVGKVNPQIVLFIKRWIKQLSTANDRARAAIGMLLVYKMLESQAEANELNE